MRQRILRAVTYLVIFFFTWTMGGIGSIAYAAYNEIQKPASNKKQEQRPEAKFQKAMEDLKDIVSRKYSLETKRSKIREKRDAIESLDKDIKAQFTDTENKLKNAGLPQEILQRHYNFVKHYEDNLKELRTNLDAADQSKTDAEFETHAQKIRQHLDKSSFKRSHKPLDPNKLPHRISDIKRKEPRTKPEEFQKDIKQTAKLPRPLWEGIEGRGASLVESLSLRATAGSAAIPTAVIPRLADRRMPVDGGIQTTSVIPQLDWGIQPTSVIPRLDRGIQKVKNNNQPILLASNGPLTGLVEKLSKYKEKQNLPQPLFKKEGSNAFNSPPFLKGDTGGFSASANEPIVLALAHDAPTSADLAQTIDVQLTPAIKAKAAELNYSPVKIYNWVRNNVEYVPTYGSIQGADLCLQTKQGNDFDIASLLIALLRASGIHARYVYGVIELPIDKVMNWVGGFTNANAAVGFIASGGTPVAGFISGGKISAVRMEHVWVEAFVKYYPLRGAKHETGQGDSWIPLDASFKQYNYTQGIDIKSAVPFDAQGFVNQIQSTATIDQANSSVTNINSTYIQQQMQSYQNQVKNYIEQNYPNATVGDVLGKKEVIKQNFSFLLGTLPYRNAVVGVKYSEIPDNLRHKITFKVTKDIYDEDTGTPIIITKRLPEIAGKKITLSYSPATANDEATINSYLPKPHADGTPIQPSELPTSLPAYLINLKPELRIDGVVVATGTAIGMGNQETFDMVFTEPRSSTDIVSNQIDAGAYYAIAIDTGKISEPQMMALKNKLDATKAKLEESDTTGLTKDDVLGDILFATALSYYTQYDLMNEVQAKTMGVKALRWSSEAIFAASLKIEFMFGMPRLVSSGTLIMDVDRSLNVVAALDGANDKSVQFIRESGMNGSSLEHDVPEKMFSTQDNPAEAISAVKALKIANDQGIPIYTVNQTNISTVLPQLQVDENVKSDIQNAVNAGKEVSVSKTNITYKGWTGCGYIITNPNTGAGAYMISGGLSGGHLIELLIAGILAKYGIICLVIGGVVGVPGWVTLLGAILVGVVFGILMSSMFDNVSAHDGFAVNLIIRACVLPFLIASGAPGAIFLITIIAMAILNVMFRNLAYAPMQRKRYYAYLKGYTEKEETV